MAERYAVILDGVVQSIIIWDGVSPYDPGPGRTLVALNGRRVGPDYLYDEATDTFTAPPPPEDPPEDPPPEDPPPDPQQG